jgi:hypothetical protein
MATDGELELHRALRDAQNQYVYFLLGIAGAAIALAVTETRGLALSWSQVPLGAAVVAWALSFYFGCRNRTWATASLGTNTAILDVKAGRHPVSGTNPAAIAVGLQTLNGIFEDQSNHANNSWKLQFRFLVAGAFLYVVWHVLEMYLRLRG